MFSLEIELYESRVRLPFVDRISLLETSVDKSLED